jgi:hypothetical protein
VTSFSSKYGDFCHFLEPEKNAFLTIRTGFFFGRQISRKKKKTLQVLAVSLIFSFPLTQKGNIPLKILYLLNEKK